MTQRRAEPSDPPRREVSLPHGVAAYTDEGPADAPAILCVHGLPGSARDFRWLAPPLATGLRVIRVDLAGFGATPVATAADPSPRGRAAMVLAVADALRLERPALLGHSMGGVVACAAVVAAPDRFAALALLASPGLTPHRLLRRLPAGALQRALRTPVLRALVMPALRRGFAAAGFVGYPDAALVRTIACVAATSIDAHAANVRRLRLPTLVAHCADDPLIEIELLDALATACPAGPRLRFDRGGHNLQKTHAAELASVLIDWHPARRPAASP